MAGRKPLRQKLEEQRRINFVSSTRIDSADGPVYHVDIKEVPGAEKITWIEKATQRDFSIGISLGGLALFAIATFTGGAGLPFIAPSMLPFIGAVLGGISDYRRNDRELKEGVDIGKPTFFNRDTVKSALGYGFMAKLLLVGVGAAIAATGLPIPGMEAIATAWAQGVGPIDQLVSVSNAIPNAIGWGGFAIGAAVGGIEGAKVGHVRMQREFVAAKTKNERPELGVSVTPEESLGLPEMVANVVAPTILPVGLAGDVVAAVQGKNDEIAMKKEAMEWHPKENQRLGFTFTNALTSHQEGKNAIVPFKRGSFAEKILEQREAAELVAPQSGR